jgi:hypothetical protein
MPTWQFDTHLNADSSFPVPPDVAAQLPSDQAVHVVLMTTQSDDEANWQRLTLEQFFRDDAPGDEIYDEIPAG